MRPAAVSRFRRGKLGGSRTDLGVVPAHVVVILRLNSMVVFAAVETETTSEPVVKCVDAGTRHFQMMWTVNGHFQMFKKITVPVQSISPYR